MYPLSSSISDFWSSEMALNINPQTSDAFVAVQLAMLLIPLLCLGDFAAAMPTVGSWSLINMFTFGNDQLPLRIPDPVQLERPPIERNYHQDTIWNIISRDSRFSKLTRAIRFADVVDHFNDDGANLTFFATPDWALPRHDIGCDLSQLDHEQNHAAYATLGQNCHWDSLMSGAEELDNSFWLGGRERERRKKMLKLLIRAVLSYEVLPGAIDVYSLGNNITYATKLTIPGFLYGQPLRVRVKQKLLPPSTNINFYSKVVYPNVQASNGIIHVINYPLLPPFSAFQTLFLSPKHFSIFTSAIQRVGLTDNVDLRFADGGDDKNGHKLRGTPSLTLFAPDNAAFERLPQKLKLFLFSPLGCKVLRKVLEYHVVPGLVIHSDYRFNKSDHSTPDCVDGGEHRRSHRKLISDCYLELPTLMDNKTIHAHIVRTEVTLPVPGPHKPVLAKTEFLANHHKVLIRDIVTSNAAVHVVDHLLNPRHHRDYHGIHQQGQAEESCDTSWEDWEDWLVQWAHSA